VIVAEVAVGSEVVGVVSDTVEVAVGSTAGEGTRGMAAIAGCRAFFLRGKAMVAEATSRQYRNCIFRQVEG
jgi:hypothetical protein